MTKMTAGMAGLIVFVAIQAQPPMQPTNSPVPLFTPEESAHLVTYWADPDRYKKGLPEDAMQKGIWQVRLTVAGSQWLWNYNKKRNLNPAPTQVAQPQTPQQVEWEKWVVAKLARDRWEAWQSARRQNHEVLNSEVPSADKTIPAAEPDLPGPMPLDLFALVGDAPKFAEAVIPMQHTITFSDVTLKYRDNVRTSSPRYAYYRFERGVNSEGEPVGKMSSDKLDTVFEEARLGEKEMHVMRAVSALEGGFDSINTYDTGFVSVGFIQFACLKDGAGSFGGMLKQYKADDPRHFNLDFHRFGIDVSDAGVLDVVDPSTGAELTGAPAAAKIVEDPRLVAVFQRAGLKSEAFIVAQIRAAKSMFWPEDDAISLTLSDGSTVSGKVSDFIKSEAGLATVMDRKVNTGRCDALLAVLNELAASMRPSSLGDFAPYEQLIVRKLKYRKDFLADEALSQPVALDRQISTTTSRGSGGRHPRGHGGG